MFLTNRGPFTSMFLTNRGPFTSTSLTNRETFDIHVPNESRSIHIQSNTFSMIRILGGNSKACLRKLSRQLADVPTPLPEEFGAHLSKHARGYNVIIAAVSAYTLATFTVSKLLLGPLELTSATVSAEVSELKTNSKIDINNLRLELKDDNAKLRTELKDDNAKLRTEFKVDFEKVNKELFEIRKCLVNLTATLDKKKRVRRKRNIALDGTDAQDSDDDEEK